MQCSSVFFFFHKFLFLFCPCPIFVLLFSFYKFLEINSQFYGLKRCHFSNLASSSSSSLQVSQSMLFRHIEGCASIGMPYAVCVCIKEGEEKIELGN